MAETIHPGGIWVFCEQGPHGVRPVAFELAGQAARLAARACCSVTAVLAGGSGEAAYFRAGTGQI